MLSPGSNRQTIALPPLHTLIVLVKGEQAEQGYRLGNLGGSLGHSGSREGKPEDGRVVFRGIPSGNYVIRSSGGGVSDRMFVTMGGDLTVSFRLEEATALRVNIQREVGYLFKAGARDGDLVIGIDGEEFESEARMEAALALAREKLTVTLTILRGGSRVLLPIAPRKMVNRVEAGEILEPAPRR